VHEASLDRLFAQWSGRKSTDLSRGHHFIRSTGKLLQCFALHLSTRLSLRFFAISALGIIDRPHETANIEVGSGQEDGSQVYFVRDNGAGFDSRFAERLLELFSGFTLPPNFPGTGIGLATVQRIVHRHGERVWAKGIPEEGATIVFTLDGASG